MILFSCRFLVLLLCRLLLDIELIPGNPAGAAIGSCCMCAGVDYDASLLHRGERFHLGTETAMN